MERKRGSGTMHAPTASPTAAARRNRPAFTVIELLVVVSVISLLVTILLPAMDEAKEAARRSVCGANLRGLGVSAQTFAEENDGVFPMSMHRTEWELRVMPNAIRLGEPGGGYPVVYDGGSYKEFDRSYYGKYEAWRTWGTSWGKLGDYGVSEAIVTCPSASARTYKSLDADAGPRLYMTYAYVGGLQAVPGTDQSLAGPGQVVDKYAFSWNLRPTVPGPGATANNGETTNTILAADLVRLEGDAGGHNVYFNHRSRDDGSRPGYQSTLYADLHVEGRGHGLYRDPPGLDNASLFVDLNPLHSLGAVRFYWGQ